MTTPFICPTCGLEIKFGGEPTIRLHMAVSHSGKTPIVEVASAELAELQNLGLAPLTWVEQSDGTAIAYNALGEVRGGAA